MEQIQIAPDLRFSRIAHGLWRLNEWNMPEQGILRFVEQALELGVTTFDIADIYGDYTCEELFGKIFKKRPRLRNQLQIVTKCGIRLLTPKFPDQKIGYYDTSKEHILRSVNQSLKYLHTDHIDLLLIHRPDPLMNPVETAAAFDQLQKEGKVRHFGVSNFLPMQFEMLQKHCTQKLVTNQVEFSVHCLEPLKNGNTEFFLKEAIIPMAWSPLAGGKLFNSTSGRDEMIQFMLEEIAAETGAYSLEMVALGWILKHPAKFIPILGSGKIQRLKMAVDALKVELSREQWFRILVASQGQPVP